MFGIQFLFTAALYALPLAGLPLLLHLLMRQKSPTVQFSTLRFIQASLQRTASRRRVRRWLLLACRILLLGLLIWALAQPARRLATGLFGGGSSLAAAIVVDTSYSMLLQDQQLTLLEKADDSVQDLLRNELRDADVAIFRSQNSPNDPPRLRPAESYRGEHWAPLRSTPASAPLVDRIAEAEELLHESGHDRNWVVVLTDAQQKEFPRPLPAIPDCHEILIDLHPADVRAAAVTNVNIDPPQPRLGIPARIVIDLAGHPNDTRQVKLDTGKDPVPLSLPLAQFDATGRAELRVPYTFDDPGLRTLTARLDSQEAFPWAAERSELINVPQRAPTAILSIGRPDPLIPKLIRLALDPSEGRQSAWPISVGDGDPKWNESLIVAVLNQWPDDATLARMNQFVTSGGALVIFLQPGLEQSWPSLSESRQQQLSALLPSAPQLPPMAEEPFHGSIARPSDPILAELGDVSSSEGRLIVTRLVRFVPEDSQIHAIINAAPSDPASPSGIVGLLWRRNVGAGIVYTWATLPDPTCGNLRVWDLFPPTLVNAAQPPHSESEKLNVEIGSPLTLDASEVPSDAEVDIVPPDGRPVKINRNGDADSGRYVYNDSIAHGLYTWRWRRDNGDNGSLAQINVQLPAAEANLTYRPLNQIATGQDVVVGHSLDEVRARLTQLNEPRPEWTIPIVIVLLLLCLEGLLGLQRRPAQVVAVAL
jgi:hypothetical protein